MKVDVFGVHLFRQFEPFSAPPKQVAEMNSFAISSLIKMEGRNEAGLRK